MLRARRRVDALGRTVEYIERDGSGNLSSAHAYTYDRDNRTLSDATTTPSNTASDGTTRYYDLPPEPVPVDLRNPLG